MKGIATRGAGGTVWLSVILLAMSVSAQAQLRVLTTAREAHSLPLAEAVRQYPIQLHAVATYYDPFIDSRHAALFVHDSTGAIFVALSPPPKFEIRPGMMLNVTGVSATGDFAPIVDRARLQIVGESEVPAEAPRLSMTQLLMGSNDGQWVAIEGVVRSVSETSGNVSLRIALSDGLLSAITVKEPGADYSQLIDAKVNIRGNASPMFNRKMQMTGVRLFFPTLREVRVEEPSTDPFSQPVLPVGSILRFTPDLAYRHRVHVRGRIALFWPGRSLCIQDAERGLCVQTAQTTPVAAGEQVDVAGFPDTGGLSPTLKDAIFQPVAHGQEVQPIRVTPKEALNGDRDGELVQTEGQLIGRDQASKDFTLVLSSGGFLFQAVLPDGFRAVPTWKERSTLRVTGICSVQVAGDESVREGFANPASFRILLRSPKDVVVAHEPSWWTAAHLLVVCAALLSLTLCVLAWTVALRNRIADQAALIRKQNRELTDLSFQDGLTGIANRRKFDEMLDWEFTAASRSGAAISLLMLDVDHFKALNDRYGHLEGDRCLAAVARALSCVLVRSVDLVARFGGEEFAVLLPGCGEEDALQIADRMRAAVLDLAFPNADSSRDGSVSVSVGVATVLCAHEASAASLIASADAALYRSKLDGRNRVTAASRVESEERGVLA